jgi:uncharacterized protein YjeT (DUF2065 family)
MPLKDKLLATSIALVLAGLGCLPWPLTNVKQSLSTFSALAGAGWLTSFGLCAMVLGILIGGASRFLKR